MSVGLPIDLHDGCQRAATQAGHSFDGEQPVGAGVFAIGNIELPLEGLLDDPRALYVADARE